MKARGKREAQRNASPWLRGIKKESTESAKYQRQLFRSFRASRPLRAFTRGDAPHVVRRLPLAFIFRAFGAKSGFHIPRLWRFISEFFCKATKPTERRVFRTHAFSVSDLPYTHHRCSCSGQSITETHRDDYGYGTRGDRKSTRLNSSHIPLS